MQKVVFHYADRNLPLKQKKLLKIAVAELFDRENKALNRVDYIFCSDNYLLKINREFLGHDYYTDILTFNLSTVKDSMIGEIYISVDRVIENSKTLKINRVEEFHRVIFHGALHLCGYSDKHKKDSMKMREKENFYIFPLASKKNS